MTENNNNNKKGENEYKDVVGKILIKNDLENNKNFIKKGNYSLEQCKEECNNSEACTWLQHYTNKNENECYLFNFIDTKKLFQWQNSDYELKNYGIKLGNEFQHIKKQEINSAECHEKCKEDSNCMFSTFEPSNSSNCSLYYYEEREGATLSYLLNPTAKLSISNPVRSEFSNNDPNDEVENYISQENGQLDINTFTMYGLTVIILILIAVILCICKRRSENEKLLIYTLSNVTANSQSRSRSKSCPSENMSYPNNNNLNGVYFQNVNSSNVTINQEAFENAKLLKNHNGTNFKKSSRKSTSSRAPSIHSVSTLCTSTSNNNLNNSNNNTTDGGDKGHHNNLSLLTKKSQYNYSIKTFSAKDPTGLSNNIKSLFANSYTVNGFDTNSYNDNCNIYNALTSSPNIESNHDSNLNKEINHRKQSSAVSINMPKISSSSSTINISPRNSINGNIVSITTQQQPKIVKLKKSLHTKQIPVTPTGFCTEPVSPINTTDEYIHIDNDDEDVSITNGQSNLFNTDNTVTNVATISVTKVK